ncbi:MAG: Ig-like domain-containing protein, partial [Anaerolineae bacterium]
MISSLPQRKVWLIVPLLLLLALLACDLFGAGPTEGKPTIAIVSPPSGTQVEVGQQLNVQSAATDSQGVVRVELWVDGALYRSDASPSPQGQTSFSLVQPWTASTIGSHTLLVKAYNVAGTASDPAIIVVNVVEA